MFARIGKFIKTTFLVLIGVCALGAVLFFSVESVQKKVYDSKADLVGTNRTVTFYSNITGEVVKSFSDKNVRFEVIPASGGVSVWLGSSNKKVHSNMQYIIEDIK